ncbi:hypothetical protein [Maribellus maritimus]|uniref:hypothetical protein n=1 Tax=Maribellus maritimus TaxID=2870838 RepID=UPI001EE9C287|nr:hypothetical protein [Maribellus maritimus]MCG6191273.1 hypothetical protein [Maribellus maritimus]
MNSKKHLGIWMDHSTANIMELSNAKVVSKIIESIPAFPEQLQNLRMDESLMHNKKQNERSAFYKKMSYVINDYSDVLLFGPTNAKTELFNLLKNNHHFDNKRIAVQSADNMTENQQEAFVKDFFGPTKRNNK